jgi:hypothetical protein
VTLSEIRDELQHISGRWRSDTTAERSTDLSGLDALLSELDVVDADNAAAFEVIEELRGRIEILMDEIEISVGLEPPPIIGYADIDPEFED